MRHGPTFRLLCTVSLGLGGNACGNASPTSLLADTQSGSVQAPLRVSQGPRRGGDAPVFVRDKMYDYAPSVMYVPDTKTYRMWWCGGIGGDHILHAEANSLSGPWHGHNNATANSFDDTFAPTLSKDDWDGEQVCDPSVVKVGATYYLYYGGLPLPGSTQPRVTALGVAVGSNGLSWRRVRKSPLVRTARDPQNFPNKYGAGQPSAFHLDGWFYLAFTDTTGFAGLPQNGAGIYVYRSQSGTFASNVQERVATGWVPRNAARHSLHSIQEAFGIDWGYSHVLGRMVMAISASKGMAIRTFDHELRPQTDIAFTIPAAWRDGPGLVRTPQGHLPAGSGNNVIPIDILRGVVGASGNTAPNGWDLAHVGMDLRLSVMGRL